MNSKNLNWGVIGCGKIANVFATGLQDIENATLFAAASRSSTRLADYCQQYHVERSYGNYAQLAADSDIDAVYIATTHNFHYQNAILCLNNGKHVLCEKPLTVNAKQAAELFELAKQQGLFIMEAVWNRFVPAMVQLRELIKQEVIGKVVSVSADFRIQREFEIDHRLRNKSLAGGALLDLGIYPINLAADVIGEHPCRIQSSVDRDVTGVDKSSYYLLDYPSGATASLSSSFAQQAPINAMIVGTNGYIKVPTFIGAQRLEVCIEGEELQTIELVFDEKDNFKFEIEHVMECIE
ncbi:MAG: Gfo/Idh/MocA family oxidoreductase, partial [Kangiellaceae bacterium]|nr:Gfo/Idh/MocA family oxidoreductase [Kangiellaceae bacterium]